ncbi:MAG: DUF3875 domain-containing protein, partial [Bacteroidales bacterium]
MKMNLTAQEYSKYYPILSISNDNIIISKTGELTVGFEIKLPAIFSRSESDYEDICATFTSALQLLPDFTIVHKQDWFINTAVATVDDLGNVTSVGDGTCTITATSTDGTNLSATCA